MGYNSNSFNYFGNQPSLRDLVLGQTKINDSINKRIVANDKILESLSEKMDSFNSAIKNQLSFNKMLETQLAQLVAAVPSYEQGRILGKPEDPLESVKIVSTRYDKPPVRSNWVYLLDPRSSQRRTTQACQPSLARSDHSSSATSSATLDQASTSCPR